MCSISNNMYDFLKIIQTSFNFQLMAESSFFDHRYALNSLFNEILFFTNSIISPLVLVLVPEITPQLEQIIIQLILEK